MEIEGGGTDKSSSMAAGTKDNEPHLSTEDEEEVPFTNAKKQSSKSNCWIELIKDCKEIPVVTPVIMKAKNGELFPIICCINSKGTAAFDPASWEACIIKKVDSNLFEVLNTDMTTKVEKDLDCHRYNHLRGNLSISYKYPSEDYIALYMSTLKDVTDLHTTSTNSAEVPPALARSELLKVAKRLYRSADRDTITKYNFYDSVAHRFGVTKFEKVARQIIKEWLHNQVKENDKISTNKSKNTDSLSDSNLSK